MHSPLRVLVVPDKFKGTLPAAAAAEAIVRGWRNRRPDDTFDRLPISDGGDGFGEVMRTLLRARRRRTPCLDAAHRPCVASWWWEPKTRTAIIESAAVIGLAMLPERGGPARASLETSHSPTRRPRFCAPAIPFDPFDLDTFGLGLLLRAVAAKGARRCLIGLGGSATNDAGFGLARALGWEFLGPGGLPLERWTDLPDLACIRPPKRRRWFSEVVAAVDVTNPLLGRRGASRVYGPQKGLRPQDLARAERCLRRLARVASREWGRDLAREPGAGAAGGLGFGLRAFLGARLEPGFDLLARQANLARHLRQADLVITGEGAIDDSTFMGKGVGRIASECQALGIPCLGLAGMVQGRGARRSPFTGLLALTDLANPEQAKARAAFWLERLAEHAAAEWE